MADCWRRSDYERGRRVSYPNPVWRRETSPPRRPPGPARSHTMDSSRDPRKRPQSRSPEDGQSRKHLKGQTNENAVPQTNNSVSRASSTSNGTPRHQSGGLASSPQRRASVQFSKESDKDASSVFVNSPNASANLNRDTSGRSTPQQKANGALPSKQAANVEASTDVSMKDSDATPDTSSILKVLTSFSSALGQHGYLQIVRDQAKERVTRLQREYNANRDKFSEFPAIEERKTADKEAALKNLAAKEQELREHQASQKQDMINLANVIGQAIGANLRTDVVSRADYDRLSVTCEGLQKKIDAMDGTISEINTEVTDMNVLSGRVSDLQGEIMRVQKDMSTLGEESDKTIREVEKVRNSIKEAKAANTAKFATKETLKNLETQCEKLDLDVAGVKKKNDELQTEVSRIKAQNTASKMVPAQPTPDLAKEVDDTFKQKVQQGVEPLIKRVDKLETNLADLGEKFTDLENNLAGQENFQINTQTTGTSGVPPSMSIDLAPLRERLDHVEADLQTQAVQSEEKDRLIDEHVRQEIGEIREELHDLDGCRVKDVRELSASLGSLQQNFGEIWSSLNSKVSEQRLIDFQNDVSDKFSRIKEDLTAIRRVHVQQQISRAASHTSALPSNGPQSHMPGPHMSNGVVQSPQVPNGVNGSPSLNNAPPLRYSSPHGSTMAHPHGNPVPDLRYMQQQINGLVKATDSLKLRCDNLQTDEVVNRMIGQMSKIYPNAQNVDTAIRESKNFERVLHNDLIQLQSESGQMNHAISEARSETANLANTVTQLQADVNKTSADFKKLDEEMKGISMTAANADKLSKHTASRLDNVKVEEAKDVFAKLSERVGKAEMQTTQSEHSLVAKVGTCSAEVAVLGDKVKDLERRFDL